MATIAQNIRRLRKASDLTQEQLAALAKVKQGDISKWERAKTVPQARSLLRLAVGLRTSVEEFFRDVDKDYVVAAAVKSVAASVQSPPSTNDESSSIPSHAAELRAATARITEAANELIAATAAKITRRQAPTARAAVPGSTARARKRRG